MSKNYAEQFHLSLDETILKPVFLVKVPNNFLGKVNNSLFYKLLVVVVQVVVLLVLVVLMLVLLMLVFLMMVLLVMVLLIVVFLVVV